jgi:DNA-binding LacI/PurR family transcriptional regulator
MWYSMANKRPPLGTTPDDKNRSSRPGTSARRSQRSSNKSTEPVARIERPQSLVVQVEQALRQAIADGTFVDDRLPTEVDLAETFGVSRETVRRATEVLQAEGLLTKFRRRGTLLQGAVPTPSRLAADVSAPVAYVQADYRAAGGDQVADGSAALMLHGAVDAAGRHNIDVVVRAATPDKLRATISELAARRRVRGGIVASFADDKALRKLGGLRLPLVLADHDAPVPKLGSVRDDSAEGARRAVEHLAGLGHRRIAYIHWERAELNVWRLRGFREGMHAARLPVRRAYELSAPITPAGAAAAVDAWSKLTPRPTALVTFNNTLATAVIESLERLGVKVPAEVSVVGCGGAEIIGLTTCQTDWYDVGRQAMEMLLASAAMSGAAPPGAAALGAAQVEHRLLAPKLHVGRTSGPVAASLGGE